MKKTLLAALVCLTLTGCAFFTAGDRVADWLSAEGEEKKQQAEKEVQPNQ